MILAPSQWETALFCNDVSHWLGGKPRISSDYVVLIIIPEFDDGWTWISNHVLQRSLKWNYSSIGQPFTSKCEHISAEWSFHSARVIVRRAGLLWSQQDFEWRWSVPLFKCLTVLEFSFILFDLCLLITFFNFIMNYVPIVTFWIFTYHKIWILSIMFCFIWSYWIIYFLACLEVSWRVVS